MKLTKSIVNYLIAVCSAATTQTAVAGTVTFAMLPDLVRNQNRNVQAGQAYAQSMRRRADYLGPSFLPNATASSALQVVDGTTRTKGLTQAYRLETFINIYNGGRDQIEDQVRNAAVALADSDLKREYSQNLLAARRFYWSIIAIQSQMQLIDEALVANQDHMKAAKRRILNGIATQSDLIQFQLYASTLSQEKKRLLLDLDIAKNQLAVIIGVADHVAMQVTGALGHPPHQNSSLSESQVTSNAEVGYLQQKVGLLSLEADKLASSFRPQLDVYSDYGQPTYIDRDGHVNSDRSQWFVGFRLRLDLADAVTNQRETASRRDQVNSVQLRLDQQRAQVLALEHELNQELPLRHELIHDWAQNIIQAEDFLKLVSSEYNRGVKNSTELLAAAEQLITMKRRALDQLRDYYLTESQLASLGGK